MGGVVDDHYTSPTPMQRNTARDISRMVSHPVVNPVQQGLISMKRLAPVSQFGAGRDEKTVSQWPVDHEWNFAPSEQVFQGELRPYDSRDGRSYREVQRKQTHIDLPDNIRTSKVILAYLFT